MSEALFQQKLEREAEKEIKTIFQGAIFNVVLEKLHLKNGTLRQKELIEHKGAVIIVPVLENGEIVLIKQYRRPIDQIIIEFPAGKLEEGEKPKDCARRELQEEIGFKPGLLTDLGRIFTTPGFCNEVLHLFVAEHLKEEKLPLDDGEGIDPFTCSLEKAEEMILQNQIQDAKTIAAFFRYLIWKKNKSRL